MINSWAAAAQAMIKKNADYRAGDGARPARALVSARRHRALAVQFADYPAHRLGHLHQPFA